MTAPEELGAHRITKVLMQELTVASVAGSCALLISQLLIVIAHSNFLRIFLSN